ncbi:LysE family translocator [Bacillus sp. 03113]|uniref:LysE family translocator n=1 Tax=Bacillus sp. 03113 TaxID=2578211 RepID=UPI001141CE71|nr:LysE family transporter [Bacillus sp. 03113]
MEFVIAGFLLSLSLCFDIGMVNVAIIQTSLTRGLFPAFWLGVGSSFGDILYAFLSLIGISLLLENVYVRYFLWIGGTIILLYMAFQMTKTALKKKSTSLDEQKEIISSSPVHTYFLRGFGLAVASPSALLWFASVGGSIIATSTSDHSQGALIYFFTGFFIAGILWSLMLPIISNKAGNIFGDKILQVFSFISAGLFIYFAINVFLDGYRNFIL